MNLSKIIALEEAEYDSQIKHKNKIKENKTIIEEDYTKQAKKLTLKQCDYKNIFGYLSKDNKDRIVYVKYDKNSEIFVVYYYKNNNTNIIKKDKKSWREYNGLMYSSELYSYYNEIPRGM